MASLVVKGISELLGLNIIVDETGSSEQQLPILDLECLHNYSLHWVTSAESAASLPTNPSASKIIASQQKQVSVTFAGSAASLPTKPSTNTFIAFQKQVSVTSLCPSGESSEVNVTIKTLTGKATVLRLSSNSRVSQLKDMIQQQDDVQSHLQKLMFQSKKLEDDRPLSHYNINDNATVFLIVTHKSIASYRMIPKGFLDPRYDYTYSNNDGNHTFSRGNRTFIRPCGWIKTALMVLGKYESNTWLGVTGRQNKQDSACGEWPVSYHGTKRNQAEAICRQGGVHRSRGRLYVPGKGIYTTPSPILAEQQTETFEFEGCKYKMIFMDRVQMEHTSEFEVQGVGTYFITSNENSVRPYCILFKKV